MTIWTTIRIVTLIPVLAFGLFVACGSGDEGGAENEGATQSDAGGEPPTQATTEPAVTTGETTDSDSISTTTEDPEPRRIVLTFRNGQPVGGIVRTEIDKGAQVQLIVRSDVEDEAHLHGYDLAATVAPGHPARIRFRANQAGTFSLELEERGIPLAELEVHS